LQPLSAHMRLDPALNELDFSRGYLRGVDRAGDKFGGPPVKALAFLLPGLAQSGRFEER
jgi:hypothetical protein